VLVDQSWTCRGYVNLDLVKVTLRNDGGDGIHLREDCHGRIGRIEVDTWIADGLKVNAPAPAAHDLVVDGGYIRCHDREGSVHQDGVQVMGGSRLTFRNLEINCTSGTNSTFFVQAANGGRPTDIVCENCFFGSGTASTMRIEESTRSGARNTLVCPGRYFDIYIENSAQQPVNDNNRVLSESDSRC
jgi:hypothetical protein